MGGSTGPSDDKAYSLDQYVADLDADRHGLGEAKIHVLGHSFGGLVAMAYAGAHPDRVASLTLVSAAAPDWEEHVAVGAAFEQRYAKLLTEEKGPRQNLWRPVGDDCREESNAILPALLADPDIKEPIEKPRPRSAAFMCATRRESSSAVSICDQSSKPSPRRRSS